MSSLGRGRGQPRVAGRPSTAGLVRFGGPKEAQDPGAFRHLLLLAVPPVRALQHEPRPVVGPALQRTANWRRRFGARSPPGRHAIVHGVVRPEKPRLALFLEQDARNAYACLLPRLALGGKRVRRVCAMRQNSLGKLGGFNELVRRETNHKHLRDVGGQLAPVHRAQRRLPRKS